MLTASSPSSSARVIAASTTWATVRPFLRPRRLTGSENQSRSIVRRASATGWHSFLVRRILYSVQLNRLSSDVPGEEPVHITATAVSLTVDDVPASSKFLATHFGY